MAVVATYILGSCNSSACSPYNTVPHCLELSSSRFTRCLHRSNHNSYRDQRNVMNRVSPRLPHSWFPDLHKWKREQAQNKTEMGTRTLCTILIQTEDVGHIHTCVVNLYSSTVQLPVLKVIEPVSHCSLQTATHTTHQLKALAETSLN